MPPRPFAARSETFGLTGPRPWALPALLLLLSAPRTYEPLAAAWDRRHPGTRAALSRLVDLGFAQYQPPVIIDTRTGQVADTASRPVRRLRTTAAGQRLVRAIAEDLRTLEDTFPGLATRNTKGVAALLRAYDLDGSHAKYGMSTAHATALSKLPDRNGPWWTTRLLQLGYLRELPERYPDTREVVPAHWRPTRALTRQLREVVTSFPEQVPATLTAELRLTRTKFPNDIDPARVGISGATDYEHDVECQRLLAAMVTSPRFDSAGAFTVEPRLSVTVDKASRPWRFHTTGSGSLFYQPDAALRERSPAGPSVRSIVEYERYQSRRDAWNHIERFLGWLHEHTLPVEPAVLRFIVDSIARERYYVQLIEAFADYALDHPDRLPGNQVTLAVSSTPRVLGAADPLDAAAWFRVLLPPRSDTASTPVLHRSDDSPYDDYFGRD